MPEEEEEGKEDEGAETALDLDLEGGEVQMDKWAEKKASLVGIKSGGNGKGPNVKVGTGR